MSETTTYSQGYSMETGAKVIDTVQISLEKKMDQLMGKYENSQLWEDVLTSKKSFENEVISFYELDNESTLNREGLRGYQEKTVPMELIEILQNFSDIMIDETGLNYSDVRADSKLQSQVDKHNSNFKSLMITAGVGAVAVFGGTMLDNVVTEFLGWIAGVSGGVYGAHEFSKTVTLSRTSDDNLLDYKDLLEIAKEADDAVATYRGALVENYLNLVKEQELKIWNT